MADTIRTISALQTSFADNSAGAITAQMLRDFLVSVYRPQTVNGFRLTTETGVPVSTSDRTAQATIYLTPYLHNCIGLYDGTSWETRTTAEISLALSGLTSGKNYDVFAYNNAGTITLELSAAWTSDTARNDALATQDGVQVKSGATTRRLVGTIRTTGTTTTEDSGGGTTTQTGGKRFVWNAYNQVPRSLSVIDTTDTWSYATDTIRQANAASGNKVEYVTGDASVRVAADVRCVALLVANSSLAAKLGVGIDSTTAFSGIRQAGFNASGSSIYFCLTGCYAGQPGLGYHYVAWLEKGGNGSTSIFVGDNAGDGQQAGLSVTVQG